MAQAVAWKDQVLSEGDVALHILRDLKIFAAGIGASHIKSGSANWSATLQNSHEDIPLASASPASTPSRTKILHQLPPAASQLTQGTKLVKAYAGKNHVVEVTADGMRYDGQLYGSLSAVAKKITGTHWNGLLFFGLRKRKTYPTKRAAGA